METKTLYYEKMESYLNNQMDEERKILFENELKNSTELQKDLEFHKDMKHALIKTEMMSFRNELTSIADEFANVKSKTLQFTIRKLMMAASILILVGLFSWSLVNTPTQTAYQLYYEPSAIRVERGEVDSMAHINRADSLFNAGMFAMNQKDFNKALQLFTETLNGRRTLLYEKVMWYKALAHLGNNDKQESLRHLTRIAQSNSFYKDKASELIRKLDFWYWVFM